VRAADRKSWIEIARRWHALPVAIVRPDRNFGAAVPQRMIQDIRRGAGRLQGEGFRQVWRLSSVESIEAARIERRP
jgi:protein phosphatase